MPTTTVNEWRTKLHHLAFTLSITVSLWKHDLANTEHRKLARTLLRDLYKELNVESNPLHAITLPARVMYLNILHKALLTLTEYNIQNKLTRPRSSRSIDRHYFRQAKKLIGNITLLMLTLNFRTLANDMNTYILMSEDEDFFTIKLDRMLATAAKTGNLDHAHKLNNLFKALNNIDLFPAKTYEMVNHAEVEKPKTVVNDNHLRFWQSRAGSTSDKNSLNEELAAPEAPSIPLSMKMSSS